MIFAPTTFALNYCKEREKSSLYGVRLQTKFKRQFEIQNVDWTSECDLAEIKCFNLRTEL